MVLGHRPVRTRRRVRLPAAALVAIAISSGDRLVGDAQGRFPLPVWLRRGPDRSLLIGTDLATPMLVIALR